MIDIWTTIKKVIEKKKRYIPYKVYSNCITEIPQKITCYLNDNILTLKSGSASYYPDGNTYQEVVNSSDLTIETPSTEGRFVVCMAGSGQSLFIRNSERCTSGDGATAVGAFAFDTTAKTITNYSGQGTAGGRYCAPLCLIDVDANGVASFAKDSYGNDIIFNGASYMGHHIITYPNNKGFCSNGKTNGVLSSLNVETDSVNILEMNRANLTGDWKKTVAIRTNNRTSAYIYRFINSYSELIQQSARVQYVKEDNKSYVWGSGGYNEGFSLPFIIYAYDGTTVSDFIIRQPYEGATEQTLYDEEEYEVEYNRTFLNVGEADVFKAKNILETQENSLAYEPNLGIDLKRFLDPDVQIQNKTFEAYSIQKLSEQGINTIELLSDEKTFNEVFNYKVAEIDKEGMVAK